MVETHIFPLKLDISMQFFVGGVLFKFHRRKFIARQSVINLKIFVYNFNVPGIRQFSQLTR